MEKSMMHYTTEGTCATGITFNLRDGKVYDIAFENGCEGNLKALGVLLEGMDAALVIKKLKGLRCGRRNTSCADQLAQAVERCT
jgi:uncharacterized protein (TIGR03905 family)